MELTADGQRAIEKIASLRGFSVDAARTMLMSLAVGNGNQAQFNHPEFGGMGQWSRGGMIMIGDMFNNALKARVDALCVDLSGLLASAPFIPAPVPFSSQSQSQSQGPAGVSLFIPGSGGSGWPPELGAPSSSGAQNDLRYAVFPGTRRLAISRGGQVTVYDIGDNMISGFSQQQGGDQSLTFTSQHGVVRVADLPVVTGAAVASAEKREAPAAAPAEPPAPAPAVARAEPPAPPPAAKAEPPAPTPPAAPSAPPAPGRSAQVDIFATLEKLADLRGKGILSDEEFAAKKAELLSRL